MVQRGSRLLTTTYRVVAVLGILLLLLTGNRAHAQPRGGVASSPDLLNLLDLLFLAVIEPLLPVLAGAGLFLRTRSHFIAAGLSALGFGALGALFFSIVSAEAPFSGALFGLVRGGIPGGLLGWTGSSYVQLIGTEKRRLGLTRMAIAHAVGIAFAATAFVLLLVTHDPDVPRWLYLVTIVLTFGVSAATGSFGGVVFTMALALVAMVHGSWGAAYLNSARDAGQAYIAIIFVPPALVPVIATAALGKWLGKYLGVWRSDDRPA